MAEAPPSDRLDLGLLATAQQDRDAYRKAAIQRALGPYLALPEVPYQWPLPDNYAMGLHLRDLQDIDSDDPPGWHDRPMLPHQRVAMWWLYLTEAAVLADQTGVGKTIEFLSLVQLLKAFDRPHRALLVCQSSVQSQWVAEAYRFTDLDVVEVTGSQAERVRRLRVDTELTVTTYAQLLRDYHYLRNRPFDILGMDEGSVFRHHDTQTAETIKALARRIPRKVVMDATPMQKSMLDFHSILEVLGVNVFGPREQFDARYVVRERPIVRKRGRRTWIDAPVRNYQRMGEFKARIRPFVLRRRADAIDGMPEVGEPQLLWLEMGKEQRQVYETARDGLRSLLLAGDSVGVRRNVHQLPQACDSTIHVGQRPPHSAKVDKLVELATGDLGEEKIVVFTQYKRTIDHAVAALEAAGVGVVRWTGDESKEEHAEAYRRFWKDDSIRVVIGTTAMERGLNLQKSAWLILMSLIRNPQRMVQLIGRIKRLGSEHARVNMIMLLTANTVEQRIMKELGKEAALSDYVLDEQNDLFAALPDAELARLLRDD